MDVLFQLQKKKKRFSTINTLGNTIYTLMATNIVDYILNEQEREIIKVVDENMTNAVIAFSIVSTYSSQIELVEGLRDTISIHMLLVYSIIPASYYILASQAQVQLIAETALMSQLDVLLVISNIKNTIDYSIHIPNLIKQTRQDIITKYNQNNLSKDLTNWALQRLDRIEKYTQRMMGYIHYAVINLQKLLGPQNWNNMKQLALKNDQKINEFRKRVNLDITSTIGVTRLGLEPIELSSLFP